MKVMFRAGALVVGMLGASAGAEPLACPAQSSENYYFRPGTFERDDGFLRQWYSSQLRAMKEPSMWCGKGEESEYRFTWLRTFNHPVVVRVTVKDNIARIEAVELDGASGYEPGKELRRISRPLAKKDWLSIQDAMQAWSLKAPPVAVGEDGSEWIFEQHTTAGYGAVAVWSPTSGPARTIGELFLAKAGIVVPSKEVY